MIPEDLFENNQKLVYYVYQNTIIINNKSTQSWKDDIIQEGMLALWRACNRFEEKQGIAFSTYAYTCIYNAMSCYVHRRIYRHSNNVALEEDLPAVDQYDSWEYSEIVHSYLEKRCSKDTQFIMQKVFEGYSQREIALMLDTVQPKIHNQIQNFKRNFKKFLEAKRK